jgi:proton-dependent oligopeptide transporter, POT family
MLSAMSNYASTPAPSDDSKTVLGHPGGLFLLFVVEMWERFSYYGMRALLVLYLVTIIAAPELKPGIYTTPIEIKHRAPVTEAQRQGLTTEQIDNAYPWSKQVHPIRVMVEQPSSAAPDVVTATGDVNSGLKVESSAPPVVGVSGEQFVGAPFVYTVTNTTGGDLEFTLEVAWPTDQPVVVTTENISEAKAQLAKDEITQEDFNRRNRGSTAPITGDLKAGESREIRVDVRTSNGGRGWKNQWASTLYGWYTGMAYLLPILGGLIADRFLGTHRSMVVGGLIIALGHIVLAISGMGDWAQNSMGMSIFVFGLVLIVMGTGHFKPCVSVMVGQLYRPGDPRRDGGFSIFYMGINLGAFICAFICGTLGEKVGWHWGFGSAAVGMILGLIIYLIGRPKLLAGIGLPPAGAANTAPVFGLLSIVLAAGVAWLFHAGTLGKIDGMVNDFFGNGWLVAAFIAAIVVTIGWFVMIQQPGEKGPVFAIFVFILFNVFFWMAFEQAGSSLNLFAEQRTDRTVGSWEMPTTWFQSINPLLIILLAPVFGMIWSGLGKRRMNPSQGMKIALGLALLGVGYLFMVWAGFEVRGGAKAAVYLLVATYFFHTLGELCLSPTGLSYVTKTAPVRFMSLLMGVWFLSSFVAGVAGGKVAALVDRIDKGEILLPWSTLGMGGQADFYMLFVVSSFAGALVIFMLTPLMKRLAPEKG